MSRLPLTGPDSRCPIAGRTAGSAPPPGVLGNSLQVRADRLHLTAEAWCERYGPVFRFDIGARPVVGIGDAGAINAILRERPEGYRRSRVIQAVLNERGVNGVFSAEGRHWKRQRRLAVTALNANYLHRYFDVIRTATERLHGRWGAAARSGVAIDVQRDLMLLTVDVTSALAFGRDLNTIERADQELQRHVETVFPMVARRITAPVAYWRWVKLPADRALDRSLAALRVELRSFVDQARARMQARPELRDHPENFLESMLAAQDAEGTYSDEEIVGNTFTMLLAGEDTTANTIAWSTWFLARHPDVQARLRHEADEVLDDQPFANDYETVAGLWLRRGGAQGDHARQARGAGPGHSGTGRRHDRRDADPRRDGPPPAHAPRRHAGGKLLATQGVRSPALA